MNNVLVLGTGELGHAIINALNQHIAFTTSDYSITTTIRPSTLSSTLSTSKQDQIDDYKSRNIAILPLDVEAASVEDLTVQFAPFTTIVHAGGMTLSPGTQMKVTKAVLASTKGYPANAPPKLYIPWQFGLDYDIIGPDAGDGLFAEQYQIRELLRSQTEVEWVIVSNGIFTSFMFEPFWGVVEPVTTSGEQEKLVVRALGAWEDKLVATTAESIATCTAELILVDKELRGRPVFIAGDSISYARLADLVAEVTGKKVERELWDTNYLRSKMTEEPENKLRKYHVVFSQGIGTDWALEETFNAQKGIKLEGVKEWLSRNYGTG